MTKVQQSYLKSWVSDSALKRFWFSLQVVFYKSGIKKLKIRWYWHYCAALVYVLGTPAPKVFKGDTSLKIPPWRRCSFSGKVMFSTIDYKWFMPSWASVRVELLSSVRVDFSYSVSNIILIIKEVLLARWIRWKVLSPYS